MAKAPYVPANFNPRIPLSEREMVESICARCRKSFMRMHEGRLLEGRRDWHCPRCIWIIRKKSLKRIEAGEAKRDRRETPAQGPWPVRCLRCSWTGVVRNKFSAWVCGANPTHPVVVDGQK